MLAAAPAALTMAWPQRASAAEFNYKFGHGFPNTHPFHVFLLGATEKIKQESNGRLEITVYGNNQLGGDTQMLSQVRSGAIQFFEGGGIILSILVPEAAISGMGFAFKDYTAVWAALDGDLGAYIRGGFEKLGLHPFERMWDNGFRQISTSTQPIRTPDDLKGFKIRVPPGQLYTSLFKSLGAAPTSVNLAETYSALQTHIVSGQENPLVVFETAKYYEVQKYLSLTSHVWDGVWLFGNGVAWKALPPDLQEITSRNFNEAGLLQRASVAKTNADLEETLRGRGIAINTPDQAPFREVLQKAGFYAEWQSKFTPEGWAALEKTVGHLA
jgi:tripartite ATP-independent transporter DctP family solute receptor